MAFHQEMTQKQIDQLYEMKARPAPPSVLQGTCKGCGRGIPVGYLPVVTKWGVAEWAGYMPKPIRRMVPKEMYCKGCAGQAEAMPSHRRRLPGAPTHALTSLEEGSESSSMSLKEVALKVFPVLSEEEGLISKTIAKRAGLPEDDEMVDKVKQVMRKLRVAKKVDLVEGRWVKL